MTVPNENAPQDHQSANGNGGDPAGGEQGGENLEAALKEAQARAADSKDMYMRALAELDNVRKRAARDVEQAHKFAIDRFANDLIGVKDSLELGLSAGASLEGLKAGGHSQAALEGVREGGPGRNRAAGRGLQSRPA
jgi:molecular chaperone GrpE